MGAASARTSISTRHVSLSACRFAAIAAAAAPTTARGLLPGLWQLGDRGIHPLAGTRDAAGKARKRVAAELISDLKRIYQRTKTAEKEMRELLAATGSTLTRLHGIGPSGAARLLVEVGDIARFPDKAHFASSNSTAPFDASSGEHVRHRLSRAGNRQINRPLPIMAVVQLRNPTDGRAYFDRKSRPVRRRWKRCER